MEYVVIAETEDAEPTTGENSVALAIVVGLCSVDGSVDFDDEGGGGAVEVGNEAINHLLPAEMQTVQTMRAQGIPKHSFGNRHCAA